MSELHRKKSGKVSNKKLAPFTSRRDKSILISKSVLSKNNRKYTDAVDISLKANQKIKIIKEIFQEKFQSLKMKNFPFHYLSKPMQKDLKNNKKISRVSPFKKTFKFLTFNQVDSAAKNKERRTLTPNLTIRKIEDRPLMTFTRENTDRNDSDEDKVDYSVYCMYY